jgi:hypothetical protein
MKVTREYAFTELGYFSERDCKAIKEKCEGTFMNIKVCWSNCAGNYTLIICSDYGSEDMSYEESEIEVKRMFLHKALSALR